MAAHAAVARSSGAGILARDAGPFVSCRPASGLVHAPDDEAESPRLAADACEKDPSPRGPATWPSARTSRSPGRRPGGRPAPAGGATSRPSTAPAYVTERPTTQ